MAKGSNSSQAQTTTNTDARVVADGGAVGFSGSGNNITVQSVDANLVNAAFDYLKGTDAAITDRNNQTLTVAGNTATAVINAGIQAGANAVSAATNAIGQMKTAQTGSTLDNSQIIAALIGAGALILTMRK